MNVLYWKNKSAQKGHFWVGREGTNGRLNHRVTHFASLARSGPPLWHRLLPQRDC